MVKAETELLKEMKTGRGTMANQLFVSFLREVRKDAEAYEETLAIMENPALMKKIKEGLKGKTFSWDEFVKRHGLKDAV